MSKKTVLALAFAAIALPSAAFGQIGIGARAGTMGIGGEVAVGLGSHLAIRGGFGTTNYELSGTFADKDYTVNFPDNIWNVGVDLYPTGGGFHLSAGLLNRKQFDFTGAYTGSAQIGNRTYNGNITITGNMKNEKETAPYAGIGFGRTAKSGIGFSLDLGAAAMGDGKITITNYTCQSGSTNCTSQISPADIEAERAEIEADLNDKGYAKWHPILSLSLHFGLGGK